MTPVCQACKLLNMTGYMTLLSYAGGKQSLGLCVQTAYLACPGRRAVGVGRGHWLHSCILQGYSGALCKE